LRTATATAVHATAVIADVEDTRGAPEMAGTGPSGPWTHSMKPLPVVVC